MALVLPRGASEEPFPGENSQLGTIDLGAHGLINLLHNLLCEGRQESVIDNLPRELVQSNPKHSFWLTCGH